MKLLFSLMLDEMHIRKQIIWVDSKQKYVGYVDYGHEMEDDANCQKEAGSALVFMLNAINGRFKIPIAYYYTDSSNAFEQEKILHRLLIMLSEIDAEVISLTFDGAKTNISTAKLLGAEIWYVDNLNGSFKHPGTGKPVQIIVDVCHMLKLVRNIFGTQGFLYDAQGGQIKWDHLVKLNDMKR